MLLSKKNVNEVFMNIKTILFAIASFIALGIGGYFITYRFVKESPVTNNILFSIGDQLVTISEFEEFLKIAEELSGRIDPQRPQRYYYLLWQQAAINAWNKKHKIDQLPEYKKEAQKSEEWLKQHPEEVLTDRKKIIENRLNCMILIECWWRNLDNHFFLINFPLFKPYIEQNKLSFDRFGALSGQMIIDLHNELKTHENAEYFKRHNIKDIDALIYEIKHPELQPMKYEYAATNMIFSGVHIKIYGSHDALLSEVSIPAAKIIAENASAPTNEHNIPINFENEDQKKIGVQKALIQAIDKQGNILQETILPVDQKYKHGNFQIIITVPRHAPLGESQGDVFYAFI